MTTLNLYLVRHGQTYYNIFNKMQGWSNSPLTQQGIDGAKQIAKRLAGTKFAGAFCSDTGRAETTAQIILDHNHASDLTAPHTAPYFREEFYGYYEGTDITSSWYLAAGPHGLKSLTDIVEKYSFDTAKDFLKEADPFHMAEDHDDYWQRVDQGFALIANDPSLHDGDNVLVISHGNTLLSLMDRYAPGKYDLSKRPENGSLTRLKLVDGQIEVVSYNE
ncbi:phosphoglycerate mutase [Ligilactobacillus salitolerans]|uniref:Phosphoglycerate mutase n=1 Tax=Ligilactobacillus salitolerans TaxID=1808352 RepID=A0A401IVG1_9LACO|nr:histidine phosphatase family protein [Ligilactobacillus salitolerans]GBG95495.1 phosphoglycerate mutase [Ligilactobacillus salitolerans]